MENEYEILKTKREERNERFLRKFFMISGTVSLSLALWLCGVKLATKKNNTQSTNSFDDYSIYTIIDGKEYEIEVTYTYPIKVTDSYGEIKYYAPVGYVMDGNGYCYKTELKEVDDEITYTYPITTNKDGVTTYSAPEGYYLDKRTNKVLKRGK